MEVEKGECIYHVQGGAFYHTTKPQLCFATEEEARQAGCQQAQEMRKARDARDNAVPIFWIVVLGLAGIALALVVLYFAVWAAFVFWPVTLLIIMILLLLIVLKLYRVL